MAIKIGTFFSVRRTWLAFG